MTAETANRIRKSILKEYFTDQITDEETADLLHGLDMAAGQRITVKDLETLANDAGVIKAHDYHQMKQLKERGIHA